MIRRVARIQPVYVTEQMNLHSSSQDVLRTLVTNFYSTNSHPDDAVFNKGQNSQRMPTSDLTALRKRGFLLPLRARVKSVVDSGSGARGLAYTDVDSDAML